jgi:hypothetical protein
VRAAVYRVRRRGERVRRKVRRSERTSVVAEGGRREVTKMKIYAKGARAMPGIPVWPGSFVLWFCSIEVTFCNSSDCNLHVMCIV